jgi:hypothetical protein
VLGCIISIEFEEGVLNAPWPSYVGNAAPIDSENPHFSLPEKWFVGADALAVENRFQFRFYQMLNLVSATHHPNVETLRVLGGTSGWHGQEHFGESLIRIAQIELENGYLVRPQPKAGHLESDTVGQRPTLIKLLEAVAGVFSIFGDLEHQIESYRLLIQFEPSVDRFRAYYIDVLVRHRQFLDRELRARALDRADWLGTARRLEYYFSVLVDKSMLEATLIEQIRRSGQSAEGFHSALEQLAGTVPLAKSHFTAGRDRECLAILDPVLSSVHISWVAILHLEAFDLWLRSAARLNQTAGLTPAGTETYNRRAAMLREMSLRYITQFGLTIEDPVIQHLAVQLSETLRDAVPEGQNMAGLLPATAT